MSKRRQIKNVAHIMNYDEISAMVRDINYREEYLNSIKALLNTIEKEVNAELESQKERRQLYVYKNSKFYTKVQIIKKYLSCLLSVRRPYGEKIIVEPIKLPDDVAFNTYLSLKRWVISEEIELQNLKSTLGGEKKCTK